MKNVVTLLTLLLAVGLSCAFTAQAQAPADTSYWDVSWRASVNGSQATFRNWSQGGTR